MINRKWLEEALDTALLGGGDFAEIFAENTKNNVISLVDSKIDRIGDNTVAGVGIRVFSGDKTVYATTTDMSREGLLACAANAAQATKELGDKSKIVLSHIGVVDRHAVRRSFFDADMKEKTDLLKAACFAARIMFLLLGNTIMSLVGQCLNASIKSSIEGFEL